MPRWTIGSATLLLLLGAAGCKNTSTSPTASTTTTSAAPTTTTSTTTSVVTTSVPATFTVSGKVTSAKTGELLKFADIEIISGANIGRRFQGDANGGYTLGGINPGTFVMRLWASGYFTNDVQVTVTNANLNVDVQLTPAPATTTTTVLPGLKAAFVWGPDPCTVSTGLAVSCTLDGRVSNGNILTYQWSYAGKNVLASFTDVTVASCGDFLGTGTVVTLNVSLTVTDTGGNTDTVTTGVPFVKLNGVCP